jgi:hypothetical protein
MSRIFLPLTEAREFARSLKLFNFTEWYAWTQSGQRPANIPSRPDVVYKEVWISWGDFLGGDWVGRHRHCKKLRPFAEAREFARSLKLSGASAWYAWSKSGQRPAGIPGNPRQYREEWTSWADWLGHGAGRGRKRLSSAEREQHHTEREQKRAQRLAEREQKKAQRLAKREQRLAESAAAKKKTFCDFYQAREFARSLKLTCASDWYGWNRTGQRPSDIPCKPSKYPEFVGWADFLGYTASGRGRRRYTPEQLAEREQAKRQAADRRLEATRERELRRQEEADQQARRREAEKRERMLAAEQVRADIARRRDEIRKYKEETRYKSRIKIVFFERCDSATKFWTLAGAEAAAAAYSADRRYGCEAFRCEKCKAWHVRPRPLAGRVFMHPETKRWCITLPVAVDPRVDRWSAENLAKFRANKRAAVVPNVGNLCIGSAETGVLPMAECQSIGQ